MISFNLGNEYGNEKDVMFVIWLRTKYESQTGINHVHELRGGGGGGVGYSCFSLIVQGGFAQKGYVYQAGVI